MKIEIPEGIIVDSFGVNTNWLLIHAIRSNPAEPEVWYLGISKFLPILGSRILNFYFMSRRLIIA